MIYLHEEEIACLLTNWGDTLKAVEAALKAQSANTSVLPQRVFSQIFDTPKWMITMSGYLEDEKYGGWACKVLTGNPRLNANIMLFDQNTAGLKAVLSGVEITNWRTAAATAVATKYLYTPSSQPQKILAIFGCGDQGRAHAECFYNCFDFNEIRLWNRTSEKAVNLATKLNEKYDTDKFKAVMERESCTLGADVIITATSPGPVPLVQYDWLKKGVHINAVGVVGARVGKKTYELDQETYNHAHVYVDSWNGANKELADLKESGAKLIAEVGEVILGKSPSPSEEQITVFQSLGMASEDCAVARLVYDLYMEKQKNQ